MLQWQFILLTFTSLLLVDKIATAPLEEDVDEDLEDLTDDHIGYDTYERYKRAELDTDTLDWKSLPKIPKCMAGEYFSKCIPCAVGYYKPSKARKLCAKCPDGKGTPGEGAKWCTKLCKEGKKLTFDAAKGSERLCDDCEIGTYRPEPNVNYTCIPCPKGWTTEKNGSKSLSDCILSCGLGMQPNSNKTGCEKCPVGTFGKKVGPDMCQICPKNKTTVEDGASAVGDCQKPCDPGKLYNKTSGKCDIRCPKGTYKDEISSRWTECKQCPKNYVPNKNGAATGCDPNCGPGFGINGNTCSPCRFGSYKTTTGNTQCEECPGSKLTLSTGANTPENCSDFNSCAQPLSMDIEALYDVFEEKKGKSENLVDLMINVCSFGPNDHDVQLLESVVSRFPTCGVVGQLNLSDIEVAGKSYKKEDYFKIFQEAYQYGGLCEFVSCLDRSVPEIKKSKTWIRNDSCPSTEKKCFCSETYRALATSFHTNLQKCPALQFHQEFLAIDIGGKEMIASLLDADNITSFCDLSNACASAFCGNGSCSSLSSGGFKCKCWFGYTGDHCLTPQPSTDETEPETTTPRSTPFVTESSCKPCPTQQATTPHECPTLTCPTPEPCDECPTQTPCPDVEPCSTPPPCEECPTQTPCPVVDCPTPTPCPDREPCSTPPPCEACPTQTPCPVVDCPTQTPCPIINCPTPTSCPIVNCPTPPPPEPCDECPTPTPCPTSTPCPSVNCPTAPPPTPCECPTQTSPTPCPTSATESPESTRCHACNVEFLQGFIMSGNDVCSETVYHSFGCYHANGCSEVYLQENAYLFSEHIPSMGFNWHTYYDVEESLHAYCQSATHTDGTTATPSSGTSSSSGTTHSSETSTETTRCQACDIEFLRTLILSGNDVCSEPVYYSFGCYLGNGCSDAYLQEKYYLFIDHIPSMGFNWHTYYDVEESLHVYCQSATHTDGVTTTSSSGTSSPSGTTHSSGTASGQTGVTGMPIQGVSCKSSVDSSCTYYGGSCQEVFASVWICFCPNSAPYFDELQQMCVSGTPADGTTTTTSSGTSSPPGTTHSSGTTTAKPTDGSSGTSSPSGSTYSSGITCATETETTRCQVCDLNFLEAFISSWYDVCSTTVDSSLECYLTSGCSATYLQEKYTLYSGIIPSMGLAWNSYYDVATSLNRYCSTDKTTDDTTGSSSNTPSPTASYPSTGTSYPSTGTSYPSSETTHSSGPTSATGIPDECDIRINNCPGSEQCVMDGITSRTFCSCVEYGKNPITGECMTYMEQMDFFETGERYCDPEAKHSCYDYYMECTKTGTEILPTCKCKPGFYLDGISAYCAREPSANLTSICDPSAPFPCVNEYDMECKQSADSADYRCTCKEGWIPDSRGWCERGEGSMYSQCDSNGTCNRNLICNHGYCECPEGYLSFDESSCALADGKTLGGHCRMWSYCDVEHSKCYYDYNNKDSSNYCKCLFGYQDSGENTCVKTTAKKEECKSDYTNCKSEENKECFSTHVQLEGKPELIQLCECKAGFKRTDGDTCVLDSPTDDTTVSSSNSPSTATPYPSTGTSYPTTRTSYKSSETTYSSGSSATDGTGTPTITPTQSTGSTQTTTEETQGPCNPNPCGNGQCVPTIGTIYYDCLCDEGFRNNGVRCVLDVQDECDIRTSNCPGLEQCVVDGITSRTFCSCVEYGKHPTTGECMTYMDQMEFFENGERYCDPEAKYPCHDYYMECTKTDTELHPTCKCEPGYHLDGINTYCTREPSANLTSICDPNAPFPCENEYDMECKQSADSADYRCACKKGWIPDGHGWCQRGEGSMYSQCYSNGTCSRNLICNHGYCECPDGYSSFDESSCVLADGKTLGGHCYMWGTCDVEHSKCYYSYNQKDNSNYCKCLFGYQDSGENTCVKIAAEKEECKSDYTNCKSEENKECFSTHVQLEGKAEPIQICECKTDFKRTDGDRCELDPSSCGFCYHEFERVTYVSSSKHGCSQNMSEVIQCFTHNCNEEEFEMYRDNLNMYLFMYEYSTKTLVDLPLTYNEYCAGNIIGQGCNVDQCQIENSFCDFGVSPAVCRCQNSYTMNFEASQCLSNYMADHQCTDNYGCSHVNGICLQNSCTCADGYKYDLYSQACSSMKNIGDECNVHLSSPCRVHSWLPRCEYDPTTYKSTCQCWSYGINATTLTCADQPAGANKKCNIDTEEKCQYGSKCDEESGLCKCKDGYILEHYGYCSVGYSGVLDRPCNTTAPTCIGANVGCINDNCDCISDEYYKNYYDLTCYHISEEDGNIGSPCEHTMICNDPNANCEYVTNSIRKCMCGYGYKTIDGACERERDTPDDCQLVPCDDENAECKYQEVFYEHRYFNRHFCVCKNGYGRSGSSEKCKPVNCDGCYEEYLKIDLFSSSTFCRKEIYSVLSCADQYECSEESNFVRILSSSQLQQLALPITDLDTLKSGLRVLCDGNTLDGPCNTNHACSYDLGLECTSVSTEVEGEDTCKCAEGFGEYFGACLKLNSKDSDEVCDIRMNSCTDMKTCVLDVITNIAYCQCITYGRNIETGECRDMGAMIHEPCDPDAFNPCADYSAECNRTDAVTVPVCKCRKGYSTSGVGSCEWKQQSKLNENCNPKADYPCMDDYQTECKRYGTTEEYRCQCKDDFEMDENNWCKKKNGLLYGDCNNGQCNHPFVCKYENCQCPENHTSVDGTTCAPAYGTTLGGHCKDYSRCFVEHSNCKYESNSCQCLFGYRESGHNTCERVTGVKEECFSNASNCRFTDNKECIRTYVTFGLMPQEKHLCECIKGFKMTDDDRCEPDTTSCAYCYVKFETALSITSSKYGCSKNMSAAIQCFNENCNQQELDLYTMDISSQLGLYNAEENLVSAYSYYCAGYIIEQPCDASGMCHVPETECDSSAANNLCRCRQSFSANFEAAQCVSDHLPDQHCTDHWECSHYNALCIGSLCLCPHGYTFDKFSQACESTTPRSLNDECNRHLSRPCSSHSWLPQCQYDPETDKTTCQCWTYGFNATSQTCADYPAKANEPCNVDAASIHDECTTGAECDSDKSLCKCKDGYSLTTDGHCSFDPNSVGVLDQPCDATDSCKGDNVICNASRICDCISWEYHKNPFDHTCYKLSEEDGNLNSPCENSNYCYDPNAWCEWTYSGLYKCMCNYGYANVDGVCEKIEDCYETPCADENAVCSGFEIFSDGRYNYRSYCICNPGYKRSSPTEECKPADCDGCFQEFLKLPLFDTHCQDELYSVFDCARENKCSDQSSFAKVLTSSQATYLYYLDLTSIDDLLSSFTETCGENDVPVDVWGPEPIPGFPVSCFEDAKCTGFNAKCSPLDGLCHCMSDQVAWESVCVSADCGRCWEDLQIAVLDPTQRLKHECSRDISRAIDCFINNCDQNEFLLYSNEIDDLMLPDGYYSSSVSELKWVYYSYMCVNYLINQECSSEGSPCEISNSVCKRDLENKLVCICDDSLTIDTEGNCVPSGTSGTCPDATSVADFPTNCDLPCGPGNECDSGYMCCYTDMCATNQCVYPLHDTGDGSATGSWGPQVPGTTCMDESECTMYNAKCHYGTSSYGSCYCSANQLLDDMSMMCRDDGECPNYNEYYDQFVCGIACYTNDDCASGQICCHSEWCGEHCTFPIFNQGDDTTSHSWGAQIPDTSCMDDTECTLYNAKCYHSASAERSCYCSVNQMLDGMMCIEGVCPDFNEDTPCGNECYTDAGCENGQSCCHSGVCGEHCVLPKFYSESCASCLEDFNNLDLSTELCQIGGYSVKECSSNAGCNEQTVFADILTAPQLLQYNSALNFTNLDALGNSYEAACDGKVAGGPCLLHQDCDGSLGLFCDHPDGYPSENSRCQCMSGVPDHFGRHCLDTSITVDAGRICLHHSECSDYNAYCDNRYGEGYCHCSITEPYSEADMMCISNAGTCPTATSFADFPANCDLPCGSGNECDSGYMCCYTTMCAINQCVYPIYDTSDGSTTDSWGPQVPGTTCMDESACTIYNAKCHYGPSSYGSCYCSANQLLDDVSMMCRDGECPDYKEYYDEFMCGIACYTNDDCTNGQICCHSEWCGEHCTFPIFNQGDDTASHLWGTQIPGTICMDDTECTSYNAKCYHSTSTEKSCYCSVNQILHGIMCRDGVCPDFNENTPCGNECYTDAGCENGQLCCHSGVCGEHCVLPKFFSESCAACLEEFNSLDLSTELCQIGGYSVKECSSNHECNEQTVFADVLTAPQLLQYDGLLNFTNLDALGNSYQWACDGHVAGGPCQWYQDCDSSLGLFCDHPDGYQSENSRCQCISGVPDHFGRHCLDTSITVAEGLHCVNHYDCVQYNAYCDYGTGRCHCSITEQYIAADMMCQPATDVNACMGAVTMCDPNAACIPTEGSYYCLCNSGFTGDGYGCTDIDECMSAENMCDPNAMCINIEGSYECVCNAGFLGDGFTCEEDTVPYGFKRTIILMHFAPTFEEEHLFIRGGYSDCAVATDPCDIPIVHRPNRTGSYYTKLNDWNVHDDFLDWYMHGPEPSQGSHNGQPAKGTPALRVTDIPNEEFLYYNSFGPDMWLVDFYMLCDSTTGDGWFELKGYVSTGPGDIDGYWENSENNQYMNSCYDGPLNRESINHKAKCGMMNIFFFGIDECILQPIEDPITAK